MMYGKQTNLTFFRDLFRFSALFTAGKGHMGLIQIKVLTMCYFPFFISCFLGQNFRICDRHFKLPEDDALTARVRFQVHKDILTLKKLPRME